MSLESESTTATRAIRKRGTQLPVGATDCTRYIEAARAFWPFKTPFHWAAKAGVKERMAKYWLSGKHVVSPAGKLAIMRELR